MKYKLYIVKGYYKHIRPAYRELYASDLIDLLDIANINHDLENKVIKEHEYNLNRDFSINVGDFEIWLKNESVGN